MTACPVCGGDGHRHDEWTGTVDHKAHCPACSGTGQGPQGCQSPGLAEKIAAKARGRKGANQHTGWTEAEDVFVMAADTRWRKRGAQRRPGTWFADLAAQLQQKFPDKPPRTRFGIKQRIERLRGEAVE